MNFYCKIGLHSYKDRVLYDYEKVKNVTEKTIPCIMREECERCGKIRNEVKGAWELKDVDTPKGKNDGD